ncbi:MAG: accessory factor UbiK family protein [Methylotenera sp.]
MLNSQKINEMSNKIRGIVNDSPLADVEKNLNALLKSMFTKMELVTREEFDVQAEVLRNTRQKLEALEAKLAALEELTQAATGANKETEQVKSPT